MGLRRGGVAGDVESMGEYRGMMAIPDTTPLADPPVETISIVGGIYFRAILLQSGMVVPQHTHNHDHATYVGSGSVRLWVNDLHAGDYSAGQAIEIKGGQEHLFMALEDNTRLACVWPESIGEVFSADRVI